MGLTQLIPPCQEEPFPAILPSWSPLLQGIREGQSEEHPPHSHLSHPAWLIPVVVHKPLQGRCTAPQQPGGSRE